MINKLFLTLLFLTLPNLWSADFVIVNNDPAGVGFNDPTPAEPVGGNPGTTLGEQRLNVMQRVFDIWGAAIQSDVTIVVDASSDTFSCEDGGTSLAVAGTTFVYQNFLNAGFLNTWYHSALADALSGSDRNPGQPDIRTSFNISIDEDPSCAGFGGWYYGYDFNNQGQIDFLAVMLHEIGHGLGFSDFMNANTGALFNGRPGIYGRFVRDLEVGKDWKDMTDLERIDSAVNDPNVVFTGAASTAAANDYLDPGVSFEVTAPAEVAGTYTAISATFGGRAPAITADLEFVNDGTAQPTQGCNPLQNDLSGKVALIDRGGCEFGVKALNAEQAGASAVVVINNVEGSPIAMGGGAVGDQVSIFAMMISLADGNIIRDQTGLRGGTLLDLVNRAGMAGGFPRIFAPDPLDPGSSISHWSTDMSPSTLMEPSVTNNLDGLDITTAMLSDIGWKVNDFGTRLIYPWLSFNDNFDTVFVLNNTGNDPASVTLTGRRSGNETPFSTVVQVPAGGFVESPISSLFTDLQGGSGFTVTAESTSETLEGRWITQGLQTESGASPSQGVAVEMEGPAVGEALLFGYLPSTDGDISAPVIVNTGADPIDVILYFFDSNGQLVGTNTEAVQALEQFRPFAAPVTQLIDSDQNLTMVAYAAGGEIAGAVFAFNLDFLEPAIGAAQVINFVP